MCLCFIFNAAHVYSVCLSARVQQRSKLSQDVETEWRLTTHRSVNLPVPGYQYHFRVDETPLKVSCLYSVFGTVMTPIEPLSSGVKAFFDGYKAHT